MGSALATIGPLFGRLLLSVLFLQSGYGKVVATGRAASRIAGLGLPFATPLAYATGICELVGGVLLVLGLRTRFASLALFIFVVVASWLFHWHPALRGDANQMLHLLKNAGLAGGLLLLASHGPGPASLDRR